METGIVPPNINYTSPRDDIDALKNGIVRVVDESMPLKNGYIGINSFGFGGANAHMLLKWNLKQKVNNGAPSDDLPRLVILSGRTEESVKMFLNDVSRHFERKFQGIVIIFIELNISNFCLKKFLIVGR